MTKTSDFEYLSTLGWNERLADQLADLGDAFPNSLPGRVISAAKRQVQVQVGPNLTLRSEVTGRFAHEASGPSDFPSVGDWVMCEPIDTNRGVIHHLFARQTLLVRKVAGDEIKEQVLAANVDTAFVVCALNNDFNPRRIERYLTLIWMSGATPVVVLTKADLCEDAASRAEEVRQLGSDLRVHAVSSRTGLGIQDLEPYLRAGTTSVLLGSSGAGKSTLINRLFGSEVAKTGEIRDDDDKGRHTTTARQLFQAPSGAMIIDTPGMRELQLWDDGQGLELVFSDIESLSLQCKFTDCGHESEPGCRIRAALAEGELTRERLESYRKLQRETAAQRRKVDKAAASQDRQKWKKINANMREHIKRKKRGENF